MKSVLLFILFIPAISFAQLDTVFNCNDYVTNKVDPFTNKKDVKTGFYDLGKEVNYSFYRMYVMGLSSVNIFFTFDTRGTYQQIPAGSDFYLKLDDGSVLKFKITQTEFGSVSGSRYVISTIIGLTNASIKKLRTHYINQIRCYTMDYDVSATDTRLFMHILNCIADIK